MTKELLAGEMEKLMARKDIDSITVNDIIQSAGVSRTTFYRHFEDKFDLINWVYGNHMSQLTATHQSVGSYRALLREMLTFFREKRVFFLKILNYLGQNSFYQYFFSRTAEHLTSLMLEGMDPSGLSQEDRYMIRYHCGGILRVTYDWIEAGCPQSPEEMTDILLGLVSGRHRAYSLPFFRDMEAQ